MNFNNGEDKEGFFGSLGEGSMFSIFEEKQKPAAPPVQPPPPPPRAAPAPAPARPAAEQLKPAAAYPPAPPAAPGITDFLQKKITELETRLYETQEKALAFSVELKSKEELQRQNMRQVEDMFNSLRNNRRADDAEKAFKDRVESLEHAVAGGEARVAEAAAARKAAEDGAKAAEIALARLSDRFAAVEERVSSLQEKFSYGFDSRFSAVDEKLGAVQAGTAAASGGLKETREKLEQVEARLAEDAAKSAEITIAKVADRFAAAEDRIRAAQEKLSYGIDIRLSAMGGKLGQVEARLIEAKQAEAARWGAEIMRLKSRLDELAAAGGFSEESKKDYKKKFDGLEGLIQDLAGKLAEFQKEKPADPAAMEKIREELSIKAASLEQRVETLAERTVYIQNVSVTTAADVKEAKARSESMENKLDDMSVRAKSAADRLDTYVARLVKIEYLLAEITAREAAPRRKLDDAMGRISALEENMAAVGKLKSEFSDLRKAGACGTDVAGGAAKIAAFGAALDGLEKRLERLCPPPPPPPSVRV
ncbi:MAG TPA: hypothetical protein DCS63_01845 [Elusimicrobia bacterium]|nr:hypothetical protein [Elusimicrobiota bacterium]